MKTYITTKDIIIPAGTELSAPPKHSTRWANDYDAPVALVPNHCGYFSVEIAGGIDAGWIEEQSK